MDNCSFMLKCIAKVFVYVTWRLNETSIVCGPSDMCIFMPVSSDTSYNGHILTVSALHSPAASLVEVLCLPSID